VAEPPTAFIQVDLDGLWAVRRCYGLRGSPEQDDPVYSCALPTLLDLFERFSIKATFFVVGADAEVAWKRERLKAVIERGHEIANHSMDHDLGLANASLDKLTNELICSQKTLSERLDVEPRGFRAPGYAFSGALAQAMCGTGLWYDASLLPTLWGWLMRGAGRLIAAGPRQSKAWYGSLRGAGSSLRPYRLATESDGGSGQRQLWEIPISVTPGLRLPFHGAIGYLLGTGWVNRAIGKVGRAEGVINYVIHGIDLIDGRQWEVVPTRLGRLVFERRVGERVDFLTEILRRLSGECRVCRTDQWVEQTQSSSS